MSPAILFPGKHHAIAGGPGELIFGDNGMERAAGARIGLPDLPAGRFAHVGDADGPGGAAAAPSAASASAGRNTRERDLLAVRGPGGVRIAVRAGVDVGHGFRVEIVDGE